MVIYCCRRCFEGFLRVFLQRSTHPLTLFTVPRPPSDRFNYYCLRSSHTFKCVFFYPTLGPSDYAFVPQQLQPKWKLNTRRYSSCVERVRYLKKKFVFIKIKFYTSKMGLTSFKPQSTIGSGLKESYPKSGNQEKLTPIEISRQKRLKFKSQT